MSDLAGALRRLISNVATPSDRTSLRVAALTGDLEFTQTVTIAGDTQDSVVIAGTNNTVIMLPPATAPAIKATLTSHPLIRVATPPLPPSLFVGRETEINALRERFLAAMRGDADRTQVLSTIRGWPGIGKTSLASAVAHDEALLQAFPDGVLWVSLGQEPDVLSELMTWGRAVGLNLMGVGSIPEAAKTLAAALRGRRTLLVIDDAWSEADARPFLLADVGSAQLITTRDRGIAELLAPSQADILRLGELSPEASLELLNLIAPDVVASHPQQVAELIVAFEGHPLALTVAGHLLRAEYEFGWGLAELLDDLRSGTAVLNATVHDGITSQTSPTVTTLLRRSTDRLDEVTRSRFAALGAFAPKPATFDLAALEAVWETQDVRPTIRTLVNRGLLEPVPESGRFHVHAILVMHAQTLFEDSPRS